MKYLSKLSLIAGILIILSACENTDLDLQVNPNAVSPDQASVADLYNQIQLTFSNIYGFFNGRFNNGPGSVVRMYHAGGNFNYEALSQPTDFNGLWFNAYSNLFPDVDALIALAEERGLDVHKGSVMIMKAYTLIGLVDVLGNVPYSQAGMGTDAISPPADPGDQVYSAAMDMLDQAISLLSGTSASGPSNDLYYGGDATKWVKLANTIKLKAALNMRLVDPSGSAGIINGIISGGNIISSADDDFVFQYGNQRTNPNSRSGMYNNHYEVNDGDYLSNYYMWLLKAGKITADGVEFEDPRTRYYFYRKVDDAVNQDATTFSCHFSTLPDQEAKPPHYAAIDPRIPYCIAHPDGYSGRDHMNGEGIPPDGPIRTSYGLYPGGGQFDDETFEDTRQSGTTGGLGAGVDPIMLSFYSDFMRAEAALMLGTSDDARAMLEQGIRGSMAKVESFESLVSATMSRVVTDDRTGTTFSIKEQYGLSEEKVNEYVDFVLAQYDAATSDDERLNVINTEYYLALWGNGYEAYNMYRRTGKPDNMAPGLEPAYGDFTNSFYLPDVHVNRNATASQKLLTQRVFWDDGSAGAY